MKQFLLFRDVPVNSKFHLAIGITAIIGAIGGVYVLTQTTKLLGQIVDKRQRKELTDLCNVCFTELDLSDYKRATKCYVCEKFICRGRKCSRWVPKEASWECELCSTTKESCAKTNEWLEKQVLTNMKNDYPQRIARSEIYIPITAQYNLNENESSPGFLSFETRSFAHSSTIPVEEKMRVRDYIETLIANMIDGRPLDEVLVTQISNEPEYLKLFHKFHSELTQQIYELETYLYAFYRDLPLPDSDGELTGLSHVKIKQLIEAITRELKLTFKNGQDRRAITPTGEQTTQTEIEPNNNSQYFHSKKYQELLATAVLNKITDPQLVADDLTETEKLVRSSFRNSFRKPNGHISADSSITENLFTARSFTPDDVHSDLFTEPIYENLTGRESVIGYLKDHQIPLPELESDEYPGSEEEEVEEEFDSLNSDNWLLKKKKFGHDVPSVGMLVPAPKEDIRALIGDKTADEISDLSDNESSEDDFNNDELVFSNHRIQSDSLISGKHTAGLIDHLIDGSSLISINSLNEGDPELVDTKNRNVSDKSALNGLNDIQIPVINLENGKMSETPQALNIDIILPPPGFADDGDLVSPETESTLAVLAKSALDTVLITAANKETLEDVKESLKDIIKVISSAEGDGLRVERDASEVKITLKEDTTRLEECVLREGVPEPDKTEVKHQEINTNPDIKTESPDFGDSNSEALEVEADLEIKNVDATLTSGIDKSEASDLNDSAVSEVKFNVSSGNVEDLKVDEPVVTFEKSVDNQVDTPTVPELENNANQIVVPPQTTNKEQSLDENNSPKVSKAGNIQIESSAKTFTESHIPLAEDKNTDSTDSIPMPVTIDTDDESKDVKETTTNHEDQDVINLTSKEGDSKQPVQTDLGKDIVEDLASSPVNKTTSVTTEVIDNSENLPDNEENNQKPDADESMKSKTPQKDNIQEDSQAPTSLDVVNDVQNIGEVNVSNEPVIGSAETANIIDETTIELSKPEEASIPTECDIKLKPSKPDDIVMNASESLLSAYESLEGSTKPLSPSESDEGYKSIEEITIQNILFLPPPGFEDDKVSVASDIFPTSVSDMEASKANKAIGTDDEFIPSEIRTTSPSHAMQLKIETEAVEEIIKNIILSQRSIEVLETIVEYDENMINSNQSTPKEEVPKLGESELRVAQESHADVVKSVEVTSDTVDVSLKLTTETETEEFIEITVKAVPVESVVDSLKLITGVSHEMNDYIGKVAKVEESPQVLGGGSVVGEVSAHCKEKLLNTPAFPHINEELHISDGLPNNQANDNEGSTEPGEEHSKTSATNAFSHSEVQRDNEGSTKEILQETTEVQSSAESRESEKGDVKETGASSSPSSSGSNDKKTDDEVTEVIPKEHLPRDEESVVKVVNDALDSTKMKIERANSYIENIPVSELNGSSAQNIVKQEVEILAEKDVKEPSESHEADHKKEENKICEEHLKKDLPVLQNEKNDMIQNTVASSLEDSNAEQGKTFDTSGNEQNKVDIVSQASLEPSKEIQAENTTSSLENNQSTTPFESAKSSSLTENIGLGEQKYESGRSFKHASNKENRENPTEVSKIVSPEPSSLQNQQSKPPPEDAAETKSDTIQNTPLQVEVVNSSECSNAEQGKTSHTTANEQAKVDIVSQASLEPSKEIQAENTSSSLENNQSATPSESANSSSLTENIGLGEQKSEKDSKLSEGNSEQPSKKEDPEKSTEVSSIVSSEASSSHTQEFMPTPEDVSEHCAAKSIENLNSENSETKPVSLTVDESKQAENASNRERLTENVIIASEPFSALVCEEPKTTEVVNIVSSKPEHPDSIEQVSEKSTEDLNVVNSESEHTTSLSQESEPTNDLINKNPKAEAQQSKPENISIEQVSVKSTEDLNISNPGAEIKGQDDNASSIETVSERTTEELSSIVPDLEQPSLIAPEIKSTENGSIEPVLETSTESQDIVNPEQEPSLVAAQESTTEDLNTVNPEHESLRLASKEPRPSEIVFVDPSTKLPSDQLNNVNQEPEQGPQVQEGVSSVDTIEHSISSENAVPVSELKSAESEKVSVTNDRDEVSPQSATSEQLTNVKQEPEQEPRIQEGVSSVETIENSITFENAVPVSELKTAESEKVPFTNDSDEVSSQSAPEAISDGNPMIEAGVIKSSKELLTVVSEASHDLNVSRQETVDIADIKGADDFVEESSLIQQLLNLPPPGYEDVYYDWTDESKSNLSFEITNDNDTISVTVTSPADIETESRPNLCLPLNEEQIHTYEEINSPTPTIDSDIFEDALADIPDDKELNNLIDKLSRSISEIEELEKKQQVSSDSDIPIDHTSTDSNDSTATVIETNFSAKTKDLSANEFSPTTNDVPLTVNDVSATNDASSTYSSTKTVLHAADLKDSVSMKSLETESVEEDIETDRLKHLVPGSIAEREVKKWTNPVDMPNNPYAPDALKKRLSGSSDNFMDLPNINQEEKESVDLTDAPKLDNNDNDKEYERYSRDYYINLSKCASGRRSTSPSSKEDVSEDVANNNEVFKARPIEVKEYSEEELDEIKEELDEIKSPLSPVSLSYTHDSLTPSEDSDTMRVYDLKKQETSFIPQRPVSLLISSEKMTHPISPSRSYESLSPTKANINFKSLQPKRKLIEPSDVLYACDQDEANLITSASPESQRLIIEEDLVNAMPSVKALAQAFLTKPQERAEKPKEQINLFEECNENVQVVEGTIKPEEPPKLVIKTPEQQTEDKNLLTPGKLKHNIAFFENLKNQ